MKTLFTQVSNVAEKLDETIADMIDDVDNRNINHAICALRESVFMLDVLSLDDSYTRIMSARNALNDLHEQIYMLDTHENSKDYYDRITTILCTMSKTIESLDKII